MVGLLFQAVMRRQMVSFLYRGARRYVMPLRVEATGRGAVLCGREYASPSIRRYYVMEMIGLRLVEDPSDPSIRRFTPWVFEEEEKELTMEEKLRRAMSE